MTDTENPAGRLQRVAVVGAGISGLTAARELTRAGIEVTVFERGRGPGGRASRRRAEGFEFDHGAQYFTARGEAFAEQTRRWVASAVAAEWRPRMATAGGGRLTQKSSRTTRYVGIPGMSALARDLAAGLDVRAGSRVSAVRALGPAGQARWEIEIEGTETGVAVDAVVLACTPAQGLPLLSERPEFAERAEAVRFLPVWAAMLGFTGKPEVPADGIFVDHPVLGWAGRNDSKPARGSASGGGTGGAAWVLHATGEWSRGREEEDPQRVLGALVEAFEEATGEALPTRAFEAAHRWRYARAENPLADGALWDASLRIGMCGDWCASSRIEGAFESGLAAADRVLKRG
jgi:hypothetical protein